MYNTLVIDPPWPIPMAGHFRSRHNRPKALPYAAMSYEAIAALDIPSLINPGGHVYLWCTNRTLQQAFTILEGWHVRFHLCLVMTKPSGMAPAIGYVFGTEFCLLGIAGKPMQPFLKAGILNHFSRPSVRGQHSTKPDSFYAMVESMSPGPRADLFARKKREGWDVWGDEVDSDFMVSAR